jgi:hypothetical protein
MYSGKSVAGFFVEHYTEVYDPASTMDNGRAIKEERS